MSSLPHQMAAIILAGDPFLLSLLAEKLRGKALSGALHRDDSTVRFGDAREVRPDLLFSPAGETPWLALEVQLRPDPRKAYGWPVLVGILLNEHRGMGDLVILTPSRRVAKWAGNVCREVGELGSRNRMVPTILWVSDKKVSRLLDKAYPRLAFFAAWAMHKRYGPRAQAVVERALRITNLLPKGLREAQTRAIFLVLNKRLLAKLKEKPMPLDISMIPESPFLNQWQAELRAEAKAHVEAEIRVEAKRESLFAIFHVRGLMVSPREKARILKCSDLTTLHHWLVAAVHARSVKQALAPKPAQSPGGVSQQSALERLVSRGAA